MVTLQELSADARSENIRPLRNLVTGIASAAGVPVASLYDLKLCVGEALANVVRHAYAGEPGPLHIRIERHAHELEVVVRDEGSGLAEHRAGRMGYGLEIVNRVTRRCSIKSQPGKGTELRMSFPCGIPAASDDRPP